MLNLTRKWQSRSPKLNEGSLKTNKMDRCRLRCLDNKALNRSGLFGCGRPFRRMVAGSHYIRLQFSLIYIPRSARLTRALSCVTIACRHSREMQRHAADRATNCDHCNGHARSARCFANLGGTCREDEINQTGVRQHNSHWHAVDMHDP